MILYSTPRERERERDQNKPNQRDRDLFDTIHSYKKEKSVCISFAFSATWGWGLPNLEVCLVVFQSFWFVSHSHSLTHPCYLLTIFRSSFRFITTHNLFFSFLIKLYRPGEVVCIVYMIIIPFCFCFLLISEQTLETRHKDRQREMGIGDEAILCVFFGKLCLKNSIFI